MNIAVMDGQGGGLGKSIILKLRAEFGDKIKILALGTNSHAARAMLKAGADKGLYGEELVVRNIENGDISCIVAPIGVLFQGGINGEITFKISQAVVQKDCTKYLIPLKKHGFYIPGTTDLELKDIILEIVEEIKRQESAS